MNDIPFYDGITFRNGKIFIAVDGKLKMIIDNDVIDPLNNAGGAKTVSNTCYWVRSNKKDGSIGRTFFRSIQLAHSVNYPSPKDTHSDTTTKPFRSCGNFFSQKDSSYNVDLDGFNSSEWTAIESNRNFYSITGVVSNSRIFPVAISNQNASGDVVFNPTSQEKESYSDYIISGSPLSKNKTQQGFTFPKQGTSLIFSPTYITTGNKEDGYTHHYITGERYLADIWDTIDSVLSEPPYYSISYTTGHVPYLFYGAICNPRCSIPAATDAGAQTAEYDGGTTAIMLSQNTISIEEMLNGTASSVNFGFGPCLLKGLFADRNILTNFGKKASEYIDLSCSTYFRGKQKDSKKYFSIDDPSQIYNNGDYVPNVGIYDSVNMNENTKKQILYLNGPCGENLIGYNNNSGDVIKEGSGLVISSDQWKQLVISLKALPAITNDVIQQYWDDNPTKKDPLMFSKGFCTTASNFNRNTGLIDIDPSTGMPYVDGSYNRTGQLVEEETLYNYLGCEDINNPFESPLNMFSSLTPYVPRKTITNI